MLTHAASLAREVAQPGVAVLCYITRTMTYYERNLPHWHPDGRKIFLTWRLYGSLPDDVIATLHKSNAPASKKFVRAERFLDQSNFGPLWLRVPEVAHAVEASVLRGSRVLGQYLLLAYSVMPNHVHLLIEPKAPLAKITAGIKGTTSYQANRLLSRVGKTFWQGESFDHWIRNEGEEAKIKAYIEANPVKARLCTRPEQWPWSSATLK
jgi:putative transposase